tara:strand:+ start:11776 stop:12003 length:228 start_codon:yes stop_codon:yes gene_type:complete
MSNVIDFHSDVEYKVLFNLPKSKVVHICKTADDDFDIHLEGQHGSAVVRGLGKTGASNRIQKIFPTCEIVDVLKI